ncbi:hypothetical protein [Streptomyces sp. NPDC002855]|uniref:hypothetical protein n=1 Tax=Streptomyces sp. NPDC002855 TaxID=3154437 RepID=UPI00331A5270
MTTPNQPHYDEADGFMDEGGKSFSFDGTPPLSVTGVVSVDNPVRMQQRDYDTGDLLTWPDGNPKWQWRVDLQTDLRESPDDDGMRSVYLKYRSKAAVVNAVKAAGAQRLERGGTLTLSFTSNDHSQPHRTKPEYGCTPQCQSGKGFPPKNYQAQYAAPTGFMGEEGPPMSGATTGAWAGMQTPHPSTQAAPPVAPAATASASPGAAGPPASTEQIPPAVVQQLVEAGFDITRIKTLSQANMMLSTLR